MDSNSYEFQFYSGGLYMDSSCSSSKLNHAMLLVGYGTTNGGQDYWILKNRLGKKLEPDVRDLIVTYSISFASDSVMQFCLYFAFLKRHLFKRLTPSFFSLSSCSWSKSWGENGYMRIARNTNNMCGVATAPCYPYARLFS